VTDHVFVSPKGDQLPLSTVHKWFLRLTRETGLRSGPGTPGPRLHDLRHTFAVRALEACPHDGSPVGWRVRALSTYLGHRNLADTCWYLQATPDLLRGVADACERFLEGGTR
jgi:integrase